MTDRALSGITRAELVTCGIRVHGREPTALLPSMTADDIRAAARAELCGYWAWAVRRPLIWLDPVIAELGLTSMARGRAGLADGRLISKTEAIDGIHAPDWLRRHLAERRRGGRVTSPRVRTGVVAWRDAQATVAPGPPNAQGRAVVLSH